VAILYSSGRHAETAVQYPPVQKKNSWDNLDSSINSYRYSKNCITSVQKLLSDQNLYRLLAHIYSETVI